MNSHPHTQCFFRSFITWCVRLVQRRHAILPSEFAQLDESWDDRCRISPSFLDIFTCRLLKAVSDICPYGRNHCSVIWFGTTISDFVHRPKRLLSIAAATTSKVFPAPTSCAKRVFPPYTMWAMALTWCFRRVISGFIPENRICCPSYSRGRMALNISL